MPSIETVNGDPIAVEVDTNSNNHPAALIAWWDGAAVRWDLATYPVPFDGQFAGARDAGLSSSYNRSIAEPGASVRITGTTEVLIANPGTDAPVIINSIHANNGHAGVFTIRNNATTGGSNIILVRAAADANLPNLNLRCSNGATISCDSTFDLTISYTPIGAV